MIIHAEIVGKSRKERRCGMCGRYIPEGSSYARFYGMAERGDKPYAMRMHLECVGGCVVTKRVRKDREKKA